MSTHYGIQLLNSGTVSRPSVTFASSNNTGIYLSNTSNLDITTSGVNRLNVSTTAITSTIPHLNPVGSNTAPSYSFTGRTNTGMYSSSTDNVDITTSGVVRMSVSNAAVTMTSRPYHLNTYASTSGYLGLASQTSRTVTPADAVRAVSTWASQSPTPSDTNFQSVCWSPELGLFCAVSSTGTNRVMASPDGTTWTTRASLASNNWRSVCWSPQLGLFAAVATTGVFNRVITSDNGNTWTSYTTTNHDWTSVCWAAELGIFVAVASNLSNPVMISNSTATAWTALTSPSGQWVSVCWAPELGIFVAVSNSGSTPSVMTGNSTATEWTTRTSPLGGWESVCWAPELGLFCVVASSGSNRIMTSPDGITWTTRTAPSASVWVSVCWVSEFGLFCAVAEGTPNHIMTSPDGITWITRTPATTNEWRSVCWSPELGILCAVSQTGSGNRVMTSQPLSLRGNVNVSVGTISVPTGSILAPSFAFTSTSGANVGTGVFSSGTDNVDLVVSNVTVLTANTFGLIATRPLSHKTMSVLQLSRTTGNSDVIPSSSSRILAGVTGNTIDSTLTVNAFATAPTVQGTEITWTSSSGNITITPTGTGMFMFVVQLTTINLQQINSGFVELILVNTSSTARDINLIVPCSTTTSTYRTNSTAIVQVSSSTIYRLLFQQTSGTGTASIAGATGTGISRVSVFRLLC